MPGRFPIVIAGHVDHGKSTLVGRLLADTGVLPEGKLEDIRAWCERHARPFEYAYLLDALRDERSQGITIETSRIVFRSSTREYVLLDAPGHVEFLKNMVTGAARAEAALLVVDALEGVRENSRRHAWLLGLLGVGQVVVVVNKMDLVGFAEAAFARVADEFRDFLGRAGVAPAAVLPVSARDGDNVTGRSGRLPWFRGPTVLEALDALQAAPSLADAPFRMPVQDVYKFTADGDDRRIVAGTVEAGTLRPGDELVFYPSGKRTRVKRLEAFGEDPPACVSAGQPAGFTLEDQLYLTRGEVAARAGQAPPRVSTRLRASLFWLGHHPLHTGREVVLKLGTARVPAVVEQVHRVLDATSLAAREDQTAIHRHEAADVTLHLGRALACDLPAVAPPMGRFVLVDDWDIRGGGVVRDVLPDAQDWVRQKVLLRNARWEEGYVPWTAREARHAQRPALLLVTGPSGQAEARKHLAKTLEAELFRQGRLAYYLGMASLLYGVDADLDRARAHRAEHLRRLAEIAHLMLDAGMILVVTAAELSREDLELIATGVDGDRIRTAWVGDAVTTDLRPDLQLPAGVSEGDGLAGLRGLLAEVEAPAPPPPPAVIWLTGLPAAGKSAVADRVAELLRARGREVERLDGDAVRALFPGTGFSRAARDEHLRRVGFLASRLEAHGTDVVASFVSPYRESRAAVRALCRRFIEVHVSTPLEVCERRDPKGLYARARRGEAAQVTGVDDPYEPPDAPEVEIDTATLSVDEAASRVVSAWLRPSASSPLRP